MLQLPNKVEKQKSGPRGYISMVNKSFKEQLAFNVDMTFNVFKDSFCDYYYGEITEHFDINFV